jgi:hypothetical protein
VNLKAGKALFERGELLKELFLSDLPLGETAVVFVLSIVAAHHDDAPLRGVGGGARRRLKTSSRLADSNLAITRRPASV